MFFPYALFPVCVPGKLTNAIVSPDFTMDTLENVGITTVFEPHSTCFAPSNLWTSTMLCSVKGAGFAARAPAALNYNSLTCPLTILGPPTTSAIGRHDHSCYPYVDNYATKTTWTDCPISMTAAVERTYDWGNGVTSIETWCCPS